MKKTVTVISHEAPTMSSLEMVEYINADRRSKSEALGMKFPCKIYSKLRHDSLMLKVPKVLGENQSPKFYGDYTDEKGRGCYLMRYLQCKTRNAESQVKAN